MKTISLKIIKSLIISVVIYFGIAVVLIIIGKPEKPAKNANKIRFDELTRIDYKGIPELQTYTARDGKQLPYRYYPANSDKVLILLHGSGWHSRYFFTLAKFISSKNLAKVFTPDLRGHGISPERRGDVDYIGQLEDDIVDLISMMHKDNPNAMVILGGHSSGGGLAIRFAGSKHGKLADVYLLLSPYLQYNAPTIRPNSGGWAEPYTKRIIGLILLNNIGIRWFNGLTVIEFNLPKEFRNGTETLSYSYRLNTSYAPDDYKKDLSTFTRPLIVIAGTADEAFYADKFEPEISKFTKVIVKNLQGVTHMGVVVGPEVRPVIEKWIKKL